MTYTNYIVGYVLSIVLTLAAFALVDSYSSQLFISQNMLVVTLLLLALAQLFVQLFCFLHLRSQGKWHTLTLLFALLVVVILVGGSIWIMTHLNHTGLEEIFPGTVSAEAQND